MGGEKGREIKRGGKYEKGGKMVESLNSNKDKGCRNKRRKNEERR